MAGETMMVDCPICGHGFDAPSRRLNRNGLPVRILDVLEIDGPFTAELLGDRLKADTDSVRTALWRLYKRGMVARTELPPPGRNGGGPPTYEWRTA